MKYPWPPNADIVRALGVACIVIAVWGFYDGWRALGALGIALVTIAELVERRS